MKRKSKRFYKNSAERIFLLCVFLCSSYMTEAQSIESLLALARNENASLKALDQEYRSAGHTIGQAGSYPDIQFGTGFGISHLETFTGPMQLSLNASQAIPWPGLLKARKEVAINNAEIFSTGSMEKMIEIEFAIRSAYYELIGLGLKQEKMREIILILNAMNDMVTARVESGKSNLADVVILQRKILEMEGRIAVFEKKKLQPTIMINRLTYRELDTPVVIDENEWFQNRDMSLELQTSVIHHPSLDRLDAGKDLALSKSKLADLESKPKFMVGIDYWFIGQRDGQMFEGAGRDVIMPKVSVTLPISRRRFHSIKDEQNVRIRSIELNQEDLKRGFEAEILSAEQEVLEFEEWISILDDLIQSTQHVIDLTISAYTGGNASVNEILEVTESGIQYEIEKIDAEKAILLALARKQKFIQPIR